MPPGLRATDAPFARRRAASARWLGGSILARSARVPFAREPRVPLALLPPGTRIATLASFAMIAQQVAGKAARDALFLSSFKGRDLPGMMAASAVVTLLAAVWFSRLIVRYCPARVVPARFAVLGVALLAEWGLSFFEPRLAAIALYLHTALFGAVAISAFWSLINEKFAPHGGVIGGIAAWRAADLIPLTAMLPLLSVINIASVWGTRRLRNVATAADHARGLGTADEPAHGLPALPEQPTRRLFRLFARTPYLRNLALVVALGAVTSGLLDYVFSAVAVASPHRQSRARDRARISGYGLTRGGTAPRSSCGCRRAPTGAGIAAAGRQCRTSSGSPCSRRPEPGS